MGVRPFGGPGVKKRTDTYLLNDVKQLVNHFLLVIFG